MASRETPMPMNVPTQVASGTARTLSLGLLLNLFYLVASADVTSLSLGGGNVRWAWGALPFLLLLLPKGRHPKGMLTLTCALFAVHVAAALYSGLATSGFVVKGLVYSAWILVNYYFFFRAGYLITCDLRDEVWDAVLWGGRLQIFFAIALVLLGVHERARFIYFEPSYLAIGLVPYLFAAVFWSRRKWLDGGFILALIVFNQSANMMTAMLVALAFWLVTNKRLWLSLGLATLVALAIYVGYWVALNDPANPNHDMATWVADNGINLELLSAMFSRAGNRVPRMQAALEMLDGHWLTGLGPGAYIDLTQNRNFDHLTNGLEYLNPAGLPVVNVLLEAASNAGLLAAGGLILTFVHVMRLFSRVANTLERRLMKGSMLAFGVMLQFESSYLRAYIWLMFGVFVARALHPGRSPNASPKSMR